tara:strand:+ start:654 stop:830 length:177 start_codon:yes stop_codon:yes gene_type:complete
MSSSPSYDIKLAEFFLKMKEKVCFLTALCKKIFQKEEFGEEILQNKKYIFVSFEPLAS